ncbi:GAF and ANTAR domain-containing protein [Kribbella sp. NPDC004138]
MAQHRRPTELLPVLGVDQAVDAVVRFAVHAVGCTYASVVLVHEQTSVEIVALTDPRLVGLCQVQIELGEGPLISAIRTDREQIVPDVLIEQRWSHLWTDRALAAGIRSAAHIPVPAGRQASVTLSLFSEIPDGFDDDDVAFAHVLGTQAAMAIATVRPEAGLVVTPDVRELVGRATGILMERDGMDGYEAFEALKQNSLDTGRPLREVAQELIDARDYAESSR